jgi:hypothetical protein
VKKKASGDDGASVFCRMTAEERELIDRAIAKKQEADPVASYSIGRVMVANAVKWAKEVLVNEDARNLMMTIGDEVRERRKDPHAPKQHVLRLSFGAARELVEAKLLKRLNPPSALRPSPQRKDTDVELFEVTVEGEKWIEENVGK